MIRLRSIKVFYKGDDHFFCGVIVCLFKKRNNTAIRCVVENDDGVLHILNPNKLHLYADGDPLLVETPIYQEALEQLNGRGN